MPHPQSGGLFFGGSLTGSSRRVCASHKHASRPRCPGGRVRFCCRFATIGPFEMAGVCITIGCTIPYGRDVRPQRAVRSRHHFFPIPPDWYEPYCWDVDARVGLGGRVGAADAWSALVSCDLGARSFVLILQAVVYSPGEGAVRRRCRQETHRCNRSILTILTHTSATSGNRHRVRPERRGIPSLVMLIGRKVDGSLGCPGCGTLACRLPPPS